MLPVLDFSSFLKNPFGTEGQAFCRTLVETSRSSGFFFLTGHGIPEQQNIELLTVSQQFFKLPKEERHKIAIVNSPHFRGYTVLGDERTNGKSDWRDQIDIGPEDLPVALERNDPIWLHLKGPNQWPSGLPEMRPTVNDWINKMDSVAMELFRALAVGLGQDYHYFDDTMSPDPYSRMKISRYPGQAVGSDSKQGLGLHHDSGLFTFILQNEVVGLQVEHEGELIDITPIPGAFIVNLGEMFQAATNGFLKATKHQVKSPPTGQERISIAYFMNPRLDAEFNPIPLPEHFAALASGGQNPDPNDPIYSTYGENVMKIRMRSHPDVVAAHYQDSN
jgi:isopenicillin N synthase-like dioxygenase